MTVTEGGAGITVVLREGASPDHDYDPAWDYEVHKMNEADLAAIKTVLEPVAREIMPALGFEGIEVHNADLSGALGMFVSGTSLFPVILIDIGLLRVECEFPDHDFMVELKTSIAHELGHAHQEMCGIDFEENHDATEDSAEKFARDWVNMGVVDAEQLERL